VSKNYEYFKRHLDRIITLNFFVLSFTLITGYFTKIGLSTHPYIEDASKGMLYGGNPAAVLALVFFAYFLWNLHHKFVNALFLIISIFNIHIISTKAIFIIPILLMLYIIHRLPKLKSSKVFVYGIILFPIILLIFFLLSPKIIELIENRYILGIQKSYITYSEQGGVFKSPLTAPLEMITYRRNLAAMEQLKEISQNPQFLVVGYGSTGQKKFWIEKDKKFHDASMDFIDVLFQYGVVGMFLVFFIIIKVTYTIVKNAQIDRNSIVVLILVFYSFFAGHIISSGPAGTAMALFVGLVIGESEINKKRSIYRIFLDKFSWLKK
jgi:O-antigen ligase